LYDTANVTQLTSITTAVTVNANNGIITTVSSTLGSGFNTVFTVNNSKVLATSRILITVEYSGTGLPILFTENIANGSFDINIFNLGSAAFNNVVKVHFIVIN
jgi:hypothetical protein